MKKILFATLLAICLVLTFVACEEEAQALPAPTGVRIENGYIMWNPVDHATKYTINIDGKEYFCEDTKYPVSSIRDGDHKITVKANGDDVLYLTSVYSEEFPLSLMEGEVASGGYYSQFDELTMQESFLGYGFDVINSSVFYDKTVKTSSPIFKTDELMNLRLLKVDSKRSYISEVQSKDITSFMNSWNADLNVDVDWEGILIGGSVGVNAAYSGGSETAKSKYFHCMTFNNQKFYIVMQGTTDQYRSMISEGFEQDLYSNMTPAELFNKYGTHFITSAVMGGKINSYYLYTSDKETSFHDVSAAVSTNVRYWAGSTTVTASGGYHQLAQEQNIYIKNTMEVIGGGDYGMLSDADISSKYGDWEKSLEDHPSLIGIKDSGSLCPIWTLIDPAKDTRTDYQWFDENGVLQTGSRAQQLQGYFMKYGVDNYNALAKTAGIPEIKEPESITNILVNGKEPVNGEYEVFSGIGNRVTFTVEPEDALGYSKTIRLSTASDYASISSDNTEIVIADNAPHNTLLTVIVSAGDVKQTIKVRVVKTFTVDFETNMDEVSIKNPEKYQDIRYGRQITAPEMDSPYGWEFVGWYTDPYFNYPYEFGTTPVVDNMTLYAKWVKYRPQISFVTNIDGFTIEPIRVDFASKYVPEKTPTCDGYIFKGFYTDPALNNEYDFDFQVASDIVLYLKWEAVEYTATFVAEGNTVGFVSFTLDDDSINEPDVPTKAGHSGRWEDYTIKAENITINAVYSLIEYTVTCTVLDETPISKGYSYDDFESIIVLDDALRNNYLFMGWYDNANFEGEPITELTEAKDYTLYAKHLKGTEGLYVYNTTSGSVTFDYNDYDYPNVIVVPDILNNVDTTYLFLEGCYNDYLALYLPKSVNDITLGATCNFDVDKLFIGGATTEIEIDTGSGIDMSLLILGENIQTFGGVYFFEERLYNVFIPKTVTSITGALDGATSDPITTMVYFEAEEDELPTGASEHILCYYDSHHFVECLYGYSMEDFLEATDAVYDVTYYVLDENATQTTHYLTEFIWGLELSPALRNDYLFMGWYDNPEFTGEPITSLTDAKDYNLYAKHIKGTEGITEDGYFNVSSMSEDEMTIIVPDMVNDKLITNIDLDTEDYYASFGKLTVFLPKSASSVYFGGENNFTADTVIITGTAEHFSAYGNLFYIDKLILDDNVKKLGNFCTGIEDRLSVGAIFIPDSVTTINGYDSNDSSNYPLYSCIYYESDENNLPEGASYYSTWSCYYGYTREEFEALELN